MNLLKPKAIAQPKPFRKANTSKPSHQDVAQQLEKKVSLTRPLDSPRKESFKAKVTLPAWSGKKRLAAVRQDAQTADMLGEQSELRKPSQSTDSVETERVDPGQFQQYGFADLLVRHKSAHGDISYRTSSEYYYKKADRDQNIQRLASPELNSTARRRTENPPEVPFRKHPPEQSTKENSVNKNNVEGKHHLQQVTSARTVSTAGKCTDIPSTAQPPDEGAAQRMASISATGVPVGGSSSNLQPYNRPIVFDIRSSTTLSRELTSEDLQVVEREHQSAKEMKKQQGSSRYSALQQADELKLNSKLQPSCQHGHLESEHSELKLKFQKYERILGEKQKELNRMELQNHNLKVDVKNALLLIATTQEDKQRVAQSHAASEGIIQQLRVQIGTLRKEGLQTKAKQQQDQAKAEKEIKEQYGQLIHEKNNQITKLNLSIKERQAEIESLKQQLHRQGVEMQKSATKESELEKLVEYYRKETKMIGVELFNLKKKLEAEAKGRVDAESHSSMLDGKLKEQTEKLTEAHSHLREKDRELAERLKQNQHEKNLLYDSMTSAIRSKEAELISVRKELSGVSTIGPAKTGGDDKLADSLRKQVERLNQEVSELMASLSRESEQKQRLIIDKKQLTAVIQERQKKQDDDRTRLQQSQSLKSLDIGRLPPPAKPCELERLAAELNSKTSEVAQLGKSLKTLQQRCASLQSLLEATNQELFVLRLQGLCKKIQPY